MKSLLYLLTICCFGLLAFSPDAGCNKQGLTGHVYLVKGNQMPSPDRPAVAHPGFKTTLYVYELTNMSQVVVQEGAFYKSINTKLVSEVPTDDSGFYKVSLKPGWYSLFVKKGDLFYANIYDGQNNIHPVEVKANEWKEENFKADYDAVY